LKILDVISIYLLCFNIILLLCSILSWVFLLSQFFLYELALGSWLPKALLSYRSEGWAHWPLYFVFSMLQILCRNTKNMHVICKKSYEEETADSGCELYQDLCVRCTTLQFFRPSYRRVVSETISRPPRSHPSMASHRTEGEKTKKKSGWTR
jgi:hypothetical protein